MRNSYKMDGAIKAIKLEIDYAKGEIQELKKSENDKPEKFETLEGYVEDIYSSLESLANDFEEYKSTILDEIKEVIE